MLPINIFSELITPISMGLRLFGNIFSGTVVMTLIYYVLGQIWLWVIPAGYIVTPFITPILHAIFDVFFRINSSICIYAINSYFYIRKIT